MEFNGPTAEVECNQPVPTDLLREKIRTYSRQQREKLRATETDALRFGLGEIQAEIKELDDLTDKDVSGLASRIKRSKHATLEDMYRLCHAFLQSIENIRAFANIPGAIKVLVKELTGSDASRRIASSECLCNLSLGEAPVCEKIAYMGGSYLVIYLDLKEERLKRTSLWTLANIIATGGKPARNLVQMELVPKLWRLYIAATLGADAEASDDYREDAAICLQLISEQAANLLRAEDLEFIRDKLITKNPTSVGGEYHLRIIFNCDIVNANNLLCEMELLYLINYSLSNLTQSTGDMNDAAYRMRLIYAVRMLSNLVATQVQALDIMLSQITSVWQTNLVKVINKLFQHQNDVLTKETLWLLKTLLNLNSWKISADSFLEKIQIPQLPVFAIANK